ncbi:hypothetical protein DP939_00900 [Spongiactinospora rosea]|uniref:Uncharacterized protein n=1 Tax=Spongiactinospora rosea TaxID=2248750 RepID=A0A366M6U3_9ACTN|nr:hypothetical protein [Spongiactinospora rosea]RBQ21314.1 hypothetical protein DP939_00900 [Spongiactinospora rosea]
MALGDRVRCLLHGLAAAIGLMARIGRGRGRHRAPARAVRGEGRDKVRRAGPTGADVLPVVPAPRAPMHDTRRTI